MFIILQRALLELFFIFRKHVGLSFDLGACAFVILPGTATA